MGYSNTIQGGPPSCKLLYNCNELLILPTILHRFHPAICIKLARGKTYLDLCFNPKPGVWISICLFISGSATPKILGTFPFLMFLWVKNQSYKQRHNYCIPVSTIQPWFNKHEQTTKTNWVSFSIGLFQYRCFPRGLKNVDPTVQIFKLWVLPPLKVMMEFLSSSVGMIPFPKNKNKNVPKH